MDPFFEDRRDAGVKLATRLEALVDRDTIVMGVAHGGVPIAAEVARRLKTRFDYFDVPSGMHRPIRLHDARLVLVLEGIASPDTAVHAVRALRAQHPAGIVVATPVCDPASVEAVRAAADEFVYLQAPDDFANFGQYYRELPKLTEADAQTIVDDVVGHAAWGVESGVLGGQSPGSDLVNDPDRYFPGLGKRKGKGKDKGK